MNADGSSPGQGSSRQAPLLDASITSEIIGCYFEVFNALRGRYLESVYAAAMTIAMADRGLRVEREVPLDVHFRGRVVGHFRADFIVENRVVVELKVAPRLLTEHEAQLINYLEVTRRHVGLLLNFGAKPEFRRRVLS